MPKEPVHHIAPVVLPECGTDSSQHSARRCPREPAYPEFSEKPRRKAMSVTGTPAESGRLTGSMFFRRSRDLSKDPFLERLSRLG